VLLSAYPEAARVLDYGKLRLRPFFSGAYVVRDGRRHLLADPWWHPVAAVGTIFSPVASWGDRLRVARLRAACAASIVPPTESNIDDITTDEYLQQRGFAPAFIASFFRPFFRGIFLENDLHTSARMFAFVFGMMAKGDTTLPEAGMEAIPRQLQEGLPAGTVRTGMRCTAWQADRATFADGSEIAFREGVLAVDAATAASLQGLTAPPEPRKTTCLYFAAEYSPLERPAICLNGDGDGLVNSVAVLSDVSPSYAPAGAALVSASLVGIPDVSEAELQDAVRKQLRGWFGDAVARWQYLRRYAVPFAQPNQDAGVFAARAKAERFAMLRSAQGTWQCGDHLTDASIDGALRSGRVTAEAMLAGSHPTR
jgi:hypothetical protein